MATYREIASSETDAESPLVVQLMDALRQNAVAIAEGATDAPYVQAAWHPYDGAVWGDSGDGVIWAQAADGDATTIETPAFADGYEYRLEFDGVTCDGTARAVQIELYGASSAAYGSPVVVSPDASSTADPWSGFLTIHRPRRSTRYALVEAAVANGSTPASDVQMHEVDLSSAQKIGKARLSVELSSDFTGGQVILTRRRVAD